MKLTRARVGTAAAAQELARARDARDAEPPPATPRKFTTPPVSGFSPAEARERRRRGLEVQYDEFDLVDEVRSLLRPFVSSVAELTVGPRGMRDVELGQPALQPAVEAIAGEVHEVRLRVTEMLAQWGSLSGDGRRRVAAVVRCPGHGCEPAVGDTDLASGAWLDAMTSHVEPLRVDLCAMLRLSPGGCGYASDESNLLSEILRPFDWAVQSLGERITKVRRYAEVLRQARVAAPVEEQRRVARQLATLGLS